jgi:hypothetical protein
MSLRLRMFTIVKEEGPITSRAVALKLHIADQHASVELRNLFTRQKVGRKRGEQIVRGQRPFVYYDIGATPPSGCGRRGETEDGPWVASPWVATRSASSVVSRSTARRIVTRRCA